ncbi:MAG: GAF domain-containing protein, partial [Chloroflexi bacterium]|nr:GAF domain-containing protein [Chloroflexota bacterium]
MRFLGNLTLQKRISLLVFGGLAFGLGLFSWLGIQSVNESTQRALDERLTIARTVASHLDETMGHMLAHLTAAANFPNGVPTEAEFGERAKLLDDWLGLAGMSTGGVFLLDNEGQIIYSEPPRPDFKGISIAQYVGDWVRRGSAGISSLVVSPFTNAPVVFATAPTFDSDGRKTGAISVAIDLSRSSMTGFIKPMTLGNTGYTEVVDRNGMVLARTQPGKPPEAFERSDHPGRFAQLVVDGKATVRTCHRCHGAEDQPQRRKDVLAFAPLSVTTWGVALRQSEEEAFAISRQLQRRLLLLGGILLGGVFMIVWVVMQGVVRPIKMLAVAATQVAAGDFDTAITYRRRDEIGQLSSAFTAMTRNLARAQDDLVSRNQELSALNSIAVAVGQSLDLEEVLESSTQMVLKVFKSDAGCVFLGGRDSQGLRLVTRSSPGKPFDCRESALASADCACHKVRRLGYTLMVNDESQCPALAGAIREGRLSSFVSVPLKSKEKALGVMNIACGNNPFTADDFRLLDSIGYHVGLAIENSMLYEDARQKEELRGQLLSATITAQEEERKRLSRELHDGCGQTLTGLLFSIEAAESIAPRESALAAKLAHTRLIAGQVLDDMRKLMRGLRPAALDDLGLVAATRS